MKLGKVATTLGISPTHVSRLAEQSKIIRYRKKDNDTKSWEYDDESVYAYKTYLDDLAKLENRYNPEMSVIKRDKSIVPFDRDKISVAISKAYSDVHKDADEFATLIEHITDVAVNKLMRRESKQHEIDDIQTAVEKAIIESDEFEVAEAYTTYRLTHDIARKQQTSIEYQVGRLLNKDDDVVNENANKDSDVYSTLRDLKAGAVDKAIGLKLLPKDVAEAHVKGLLHWHDLDYSPATAMHNCFARMTEFITDKGIKSFNDFSDGDIINVLTPSGVYRKATVKSYGNSNLNTITFKRAKGKPITIHATGNHRWLLHDDTETTNLKINDRLAKYPTPTTINTNTMSDEERYYWLKGFICGDGTRYNHASETTNEGTRIRLCGRKKQYATLFEQEGFSQQTILDGDPIYIKSGFKKELIHDSEITPLSVSMFMDGLLAADGKYTNKNREYKTDIYTTNPELLEWILKYAPMAKYYITAVTDHTGEVTNYAPEGRKYTQEVRFMGKQHTNTLWKVINIEQNTSTETVWCLEVEDEHAFMLSNGITTGNCGLINLKDMLANGFHLGNADVESPKSISTAVAQASQILASISSGQYGGTSYDRIDEVLAPYAELSYNKHLASAIEDEVPNPEKVARKHTIKEIKSSMQSLEYEINTLFSTNGQTPFSTLGFGLGTSWYEREIQIAILEQRIAGLGKDGRTAIFPKLLFTLKDGVNKKPTDPNYDIKQLALKSVVKRMAPEILNYDNIVNITGSFKCAMGCRSFLNGLTNEDLKAQGEQQDYSSGRLNLGVVSLNLPRVALDSNGDMDKFWVILDERIALMKKALLFRIERVKEALPKMNPTGFMYGGYGRLNSADDIDVLLKNNRASISFGYVGLYEMAARFYGDWQQDHSYDKDARDFAYNVLKYLNETVAEWKAEYGYAFSCYGTPGESLNSSFEERDHKLYPNVPHVTDHDFYTNSFHYFVERKPTPFEKIEFEAPFQALSTGGFISYVELPILKFNLEAIEAIWDYADNAGIGYMEINTAIDHCLKCGFEGEYIGDEKGYHCPDCGNDDPTTSDVTRRTCGYLGNPMQRPMKQGRQKEIIHRVKHISGTLGQLSNGTELQSDDADKLKVR